MARRYSYEEKQAALHVVREVGATEAAKLVGISKYTLTEWKLQTKAFAYSSFVGDGRPFAPGERELLLEQLIHEQEIEKRHGRWRTYRHEAPGAGSLLMVPLDMALQRSGIAQRHLLEWLDPTFDEVAEGLAA